MSDNEARLLKSPTRTPWNKGKLIGAKPPLRPNHVWSIRTRLMVEGRTRDLALFNLVVPSIGSCVAATWWLSRSSLDGILRSDILADIG